jgi:DNA-binding CsgD family transcriptional regulator
MMTPVTASDRDLRALARIVSRDRVDRPGGQGLPVSLLADLMSQIRCDIVSFAGYDSDRREYWFGQNLPGDVWANEDDDLDRASWQHYWETQPCSYPDRTGDLGTVVTIADFYSARQWHSTGMYTDVYRPQGLEHELMLSLPAGPPRAPGRTIRLFFLRGSGADFRERDRAVLTLLRPHLHQAYLDAERGRHPIPQLTARQQELLSLVAAGHTNARIARRLGITETTVRTHLEHIYRRLQVSSRTAAVTRAFPAQGSM